MIRGELNISSIDPPVDSVQVLNPYRFGLNLAVSEQSEVSNEYISNHQISIGFNDGFSTTGYQNSYSRGQVFDSYRFESDLLAYDNIGLSNPRYNFNPH